MFEQIEQSKKDLGNNTELQKTTYKAADEDIYDADGDGEESVSEYIEKKKMSKTNAEGSEETEKPKKSAGEKDKEILQKAGKVASGIGNAVGNVANVIGAVPHVAAFTAGLGASEIAKIIKENLGK